MPASLLVGLGAVFVVVTLIAALAVRRLLFPDVVRARLRELSGDRAEPGATTWPGGDVGRVTPNGLTASEAGVTGRARELRQAGFRSPLAPRLFRLAQTGCAALLGLAAWAAFTAMAGLAAAVAGFVGPELWLIQRVERQRRLIQNGLPDALDLMVVCIEAGSGIDPALIRASEDLDFAYPELAWELRVVILEMRAGMARLEALRHFAERTKVEDVRMLVSLLAQTERFGGSVAQALRTHARASRTVRRQRAEERASRVAVKLVFPLVFFLFPALYVVVLGPVVVQVVKAFYR